jgi:hypothetical protein
MVPPGAPAEGFPGALSAAHPGIQKMVKILVQAFQIAVEKIGGNTRFLKFAVRK